MRSLDAYLKDEFRAGFFPRHLASWIEDPIDETATPSPDVAACLAALKAGQRDFSYPGHDRRVFDILREQIAKRHLRKGADIGCATGAFPAMQLAAGIEECTVFEIRPVEMNDPRVRVTVKDLTYATDVEAEFDLVTCLSTIEHVGLGRYGDPLDPWGDIKMAANLRRLVRPGGVMLLSFPSGHGCVVFNKHRIYSAHRRDMLFGDFKVVRRVSDRSAYGQFRQWAAQTAHRAGSLSQPIYLLERAEG